VTPRAEEEQEWFSAGGANRSGEATGKVQDLATAEHPTPVQLAEQADQRRILRWSEMVGD
jgi:hypothetical protein